MLTKLRNPLEKDKTVIAALLFATALIIFVIYLFSFGFFYIYEFKNFKSDLQSEMAHVKKGLGVEISLDDHTLPYNEQDWNKFSFIVRSLKVGKKQKNFPGDTSGEVLKFVFNDGTSIEFCATEIPEEVRQRDDGICVRYIDTSGKVLIFDTDQYGFEKIHYWFQ